MMVFIFPVSSFAEHVMSTLPRTVRLRNRADFQRVFSEGSGTRIGQVTVKYCLRQPDTEHHVRTGFVVAKRFVRSAVRRNRFKRLLRESYRLLRDEFELKSSGIWVDLVLIWGGTEEQAVRPDFHEVHNDVRRAMNTIAKRLHRQQAETIEK